MADEFSGRLQSRVTLERWIEGDTPGWVAEAELWAELLPAAERAVRDGGIDLWRARMTVLIRTRDVDLGCRLRWQGRAYAVLAIRRNPAAPDRLELLVEERAA